MRDGFLGLRHHTIICGHYQNHDVGRFGAACTHRGKRLVTRRIQESNHAARRIDVICADVLGNPTRFARGDTGAAYIIEQGSLAVIDVTHHRDDRCARFQYQIMMRFGIHQIGIRIVQLGGLGNVSHLFHHNHRGFLIEHLIDGHH